MKKRSPITVYLLTFLTGSIYFFFWMFYLMRDINNLKEEKVFNIRKKALNILIVLISYIIVFVLVGISITLKAEILMYVFGFIGFILAVLWFVIIIRYLRQISDQIKVIESSQMRCKQISKNNATILFFLYFIAIPYIQFHMNNIIEYNNNSDNEIIYDNKASILKIVVSVILVFALFVSSVIALIKNSASYKTAIKYIESQSEISSNIEGIVGYGLIPNGSIQITNGYGKAGFNINVKGHIKNITVYLFLEKAPHSDWVVKTIRF